MKNFTKHAVVQSGHKVFRLIDDDGCVVEAFDHFTATLLKKTLAYATVKRYLEVVANFLDYLAEVKAFGTPVTSLYLNEAVGYYLQVRGLADRLRAAPDDPEDRLVTWGKPVVVSLGLRSVAVSSNMVSAINLFLSLSETLSRTDWERVAHLGLEAKRGDYEATILQVDGSDKISLQERKALRQSSMLANVMRMNPKGITRPGGMKHPKRHQTDEALDFPLERVGDLMVAARSSRDRALWLLLAASGIRTSEALTLKWEHIDAMRQAVFVEDPNRLRFSNDLPLAEAMRFKGRAVSVTFLIQPFKDAFFNELATYIRTEYVSGAAHDYVFQDVRSGPGRGRPMHQLSDTARNRNFKRAVARAGIAERAPGKTWTLHSLRHGYGVYTLNSLPVPGGYGLELKEVMQLMGHTSETTTALYARSDRTILAAKLEYADQYVSSTTAEWHSIPEMIAKRLRHDAAQYEARGLL